MSPQTAQHLHKITSSSLMQHFISGDLKSLEWTENITKLMTLVNSRLFSIIYHLVSFEINV